MSLFLLFPTAEFGMILPLYLPLVTSKENPREAKDMSSLLFLIYRAAR